MTCLLYTSHDPYVLISILSAWHEGVFTLDEVQSTLEMLFAKQYILTVEEEVQVRYRTETRTAVSYTHLDVYKRQLLSSTAKSRI